MWQVGGGGEAAQQVQEEQLAGGEGRRGVAGIRQAIEALSLPNRHTKPFNHAIHFSIHPGFIQGFKTLANNL